MRLHSSQRKRTGPSCWPKGRTSPAVLSVLETCPFAVKEKKVKEKLESTNRRRAEAEAKVCLELDRSVVLSAVLPRQFFRLQCQCRQQSYPAVAARTRRERLQRWRRREASTSAHTPKRMRASVRKSVLNSELAAALDRTKVSNRNAVHVLSAAARKLRTRPPPSWC
ncbi:hypothetical protein GWK47_024619 [Chionoecetes opilio]|uniref:Uncharacterized protein n=1 Tax=Chionoecetes opilio TaxID=41210 RepID=A0A8J4XLN9_CHIOP|nr:hypothetical protein GWK47_024619 [Chionoecetes opilio]